MKPHPRIRKTIKWGGAAVTVLLAVVWLHYAIFGGASRTPPTPAPAPSNPHVWNSAPASAAGYHIYSIRQRFLPLALLMLIPTAAAWYLDTLARRRANEGGNLCPNCRYDRAGLAAGAKCPECGMLPADAKP
jgi:hypothetical protein